jgi:hypothetical protein
MGTTTCSQNVVEGDRIKLSLKREKTSQYVWPSTCFFLTLENTFHFIGPVKLWATLRKYVCFVASFLLGVNGRKQDK